MLLRAPAGCQQRHNFVSNHREHCADAEAKTNRRAHLAPSHQNVIVKLFTETVRCERGGGSLYLPSAVCAGLFETVAQTENILLLDTSREEEVRPVV